MPYVTTTFTEGGFLTELSTLLTQNGWVSEKTFRKVGYEFTRFFYTTLNAGSIPIPKLEFELWLADHIIVKNTNGSRYGFARISKVTKKYEDVPTKFKKADGSPDPVKLEDETLREELHTWMASQSEAIKIDTSEIFFYMLEKTPTIPTGKTAVYPVVSVQSVIDVEVLSYLPVKNTSGSGYTFQEALEDPLTLQSPMMKVKTREIGTQSNGWLTNWWLDSKLRVEGLVSPQTVSLIIQADNTAAYEDNNVPTIPIYMGQIVPLDASDTNTAVLFGGSAVSLATFDYTDTKPFVSTPLVPLNKAYPKNPGNGIDNIIVKRTKFGSYYQAYSLSFHTAPDQMPPDRLSESNRQYVSSWKNERNEEYAFKYNPSGYTKKTHASRAYVIHPDEGMRGYLKDMLMTSSIGHRNRDQLKLPIAACPDVYHIYRYFVVDAVSPLTKRPATPFSPAGYGIFEKEL